MFTIFFREAGPSCCDVRKMGKIQLDNSENPPPENGDFGENVKNFSKVCGCSVPVALVARRCNSAALRAVVPASRTKSWVVPVAGAGEI